MWFDKKVLICGMKVLIVSATSGEVSMLNEYLAGSTERLKVNLAILITGVGMIATAYALTKALQNERYDLVLLAGVGGSFDTSIPMGSVVMVVSEQYGDFGAEDHEDYLDIFEMGLINGGEHPHMDKMLHAPELPEYPTTDLKPVKGLTVNMVSGKSSTITHRNNTYGCQVESMEGAAFHYVCLRENMAFMQVRAISNYVVPRDKSPWQMKEAIVALNTWLIGFVGGL